MTELSGFFGKWQEMKMVQLKFNVLRHKIWGTCKLTALKENFPPHFHSYYTFGVLLDGQRRMKIGDERKNMEAGDIAIINPGDVHSCLHASAKDCVWLCCTISISLATLLAGSQTPVSFVNWPDSASSERLANLLETFNSPFPENAEFQLGELLRAIPRSSRNTQNSNYDTFLDEQNFFWPGLGELGKKAGTGKYAFLRNFHNCAKLTPHRYYDAMRIAKACKLLAEGKKPVHCALEAGYCDQSHLNRHFTRYLGYSPGCFRQALQAGKETDKLQ